MKGIISSLGFSGLVFLVVVLCFSFSAADDAYYFYDGAGRLSRAIIGPTGLIYKYDEVGNLLTVTSSTTSPNPPIIESIVPDAVFMGKTVQVTITGRNLLSTKAVTSDNTTFSIRMLNVSDLKIDADIIVPATAIPGLANLIVTNPYGSASVSISIFRKLTFTPGQLALTPGNTGSITAGVEPVTGRSITLGLTNDNPAVVTVPSVLPIPSSGSFTFNVNALANGIATIDSLSTRSVIFVTDPFRPEPGEEVVNEAGPISVRLEDASSQLQSSTQHLVSVYVEPPTAVEAEKMAAAVSVYMEQPVDIPAIKTSGSVSIDIDSAAGDSTIASPIVSVKISP